MNKQIMHPRTLTLGFFILVAAFSRLLLVNAGEGPMSNFTPICAMALFGGAYFSRAKSFIFPLLALWLSDLVLCRISFYHEWRWFYQDFYWTYGAFALMVVVGRLVQPSRSVGRFLVASLAAVLIHWVVTDFGVWMTGLIFPHTFAGWVECMVVAIPYEGTFIAATVVYGAVMFGAFEWLQNRMVSLRLAAN